jgi:hypothetical protein
MQREQKCTHIQNIGPLNNYINNTQCYFKNKNNMKFNENTVFLLFKYITNTLNVCNSSPPVHTLIGVIQCLGFKVLRADPPSGIN